MNKFCKTYFLAIFCLLVTSQEIKIRAQDYPMNLEGTYLGQILPGLEPKIFGPPNLQSNDEWFWHSALVFTPDGQEFYLDIYIPDEPNNPGGIRVRYMEMHNNFWTSPHLMGVGGFLLQEMKLSICT